MSTFMKAFNALQLTVLFAVWPFLCAWVKTATFYASGAVFWILIVAYVIGFIMMIIAVYSALDGD